MQRTDSLQSFACVHRAIPVHIGIYYRDYEGTGGFPRDWQKFACELGELGETITVYAQNGARQSDPHRNVKIKRLAENKPFSFAAGSRFLEAVTGDNKRPDILEIVGAYIPQNISIARCALSVGIPYVYTPLGLLAPKIVARHPLKKRLFIEALLRRAMQHAAGLHLFSDMEDRWTARYVRRPIIQTTLGAFAEDVPPALDRRYLRRELKLPETQVILLYLGRIDASGKGLHTLIDGFSVIRDRVPDATLVFIGPDEKDNRRSLEARVERSGLRQRIFFMDPLYGAAKFSAMASADLFVYPSNYDIIPRSIREALSVGCPVLASEETHVGDILRKHNAGAVTPVDAVEIGNVIVRLVADRGALAAMRRNASAASETELDWRTQAARLRDGYRGLLGIH